MINTYQIAGLTVNMDIAGKLTADRSEKYRCAHTSSPDITINLSQPYIERLQKLNPHLSYDDCEYISAGAQFYAQLIQFDGFLLHASAIAYENKAYLFSAPSGTGKSTHAQLWKERFGADRVVSINDDKPALRLIDGKYFAFGTPFSGKTDQNENLRVPLHAICILTRAERNTIGRISAKDALLPLLNQTIRPADERNMTRLLSLIDALVTAAPVYQMGCNVSLEAPLVAYRGMADTGR